MKYNFTFRFKTGDLIPEVREVENEINETMMGFGFPEKIYLQSEVPCLMVTSNRPLADEEKAKLIQILKKEFEKNEFTKNMELVKIEESD